MTLRKTIILLILQDQVAEEVAIEAIEVIENVEEVHPQHADQVLQMLGLHEKILITMTNGVMMNQSFLLKKK